MTEAAQSLGKPESSGIRLVPVVLGVLFVFVLWRSSGISWDLTAQDTAEAREAISEGLAKRAAGSSLIEQLVWVFFGCLGLYFHVTNRERALHIWTKAWPLLVLLVLILLSPLWSSVPDIALRRAIKHVLLVLAIAGVVIGADSPRELFRIAIAFTGLVMLANFASILVIPEVAISRIGAFKGLHIHKNTAGAFAMISLFIWLSAARYAHGGWIRTGLFCGSLLIFLFLLATNSWTAIGCTLLALILVLPLTYLARHAWASTIFALAAVFLALIAVYALVLMNVSFADIIDIIQGSKTTLADRGVIWGVVYDIFLANPVLGIGYGSLWSTGEVAALQTHGNLALTGFRLRLTQAHNGYVDLLATLGIAGAGIVLALLSKFAIAIARGLKSKHSSKSSLVLAEISALIVVSLLVVNVTETTFLGTKIVWTSCLLCYLLLCATGLKIRPDEAANIETAPAEPPGRIDGKARGRN